VPGPVPSYAAGPGLNPFLTLNLPTWSAFSQIVCYGVNIDTSATKDVSPK
jgi:hypothetical protein